MSELAQTHYEGCWENPRHHGCAVAKIKELSALSHVAPTELTTLSGFKTKDQKCLGCGSWAPYPPAHVCTNPDGSPMYPVRPDVIGECELVRLHYTDSGRPYTNAEAVQTVSAPSSTATPESDLWNAVRLAAEGSDWKRDASETLAQWAERQLRHSAEKRVAVIEECRAVVFHRFRKATQHNLVKSVLEAIDALKSSAATDGNGHAD